MYNYPNMSFVLLPLHILTLGVTVIGILLADRQATLWMRGTKQTLSKRTMERYHWWVMVGLWLMIATGFGLFWQFRVTLLATPAFYVKMFFVAVVLVNGFAIQMLMKVAYTRTWKSLSFREKLPLFISGAASTIGWLGAALAATMLLPD